MASAARQEGVADGGFSSQACMPGGRSASERRAIVLVVDDDPDLRASIVEFLECSGYEVGAAADGQEAVDSLLEGLEPDLVVLDLVMPKMDGWAMLKWLKADPHHADRPVLVMSATANDRPTEASAWLPKPFQRDEFHRAVARLCGH